MGECQQQKHTQHAPSMKTECDHFSGWINNGHMHKNLTQNGEPKRDSWGTQKKNKNSEDMILRVPDQNVISQACYVVAIYRSGPEPSISWWYSFQV